MTEQVFASIWDAIEDDPALRAGLKIRSELMDVIETQLRQLQWSPALTAQKFGMTPERLDMFQRGQIDAFRIEDLLAMAAATGLDIHIQARAAA